MYDSPYPGFGGQSFGSKSSKSWYGTRFLKFNQSCMFSAVEHQKRCFSCSWVYIMQLTYILSRFPMPFWPLEPDAPLAFPTLIRGTETSTHTTGIWWDQSNLTPDDSEIVTGVTLGGNFCFRGGKSVLNCSDRLKNHGNGWIRTK